MHPQLQEIDRELARASDRLERLFDGAPPSGDLNRRPAAGSWSALDCIEHLNLTSRAMLPSIREALGDLPPSFHGRYRRDPMGWIVWRGSREKVGMRVRTSPSFIPPSELDPVGVRSEFERHQRDAHDLLITADGRPLNSLRVTSPFDRRVRYNLFSALSIFASHQHRHLAQAERAIAVARGVPVENV